MSDRLLPSGQWLKERLSTRWVGKSEKMCRRDRGYPQNSPASIQSTGSPNAAR